jgi:hypothetical protein
MMRVSLAAESHTLARRRDVGLEDVCRGRHAPGQAWHAIIEDRDAGFVLRTCQRDARAACLDIDRCGRGIFSMAAIACQVVMN